MSRILFAASFVVAASTSVALAQSAPTVAPEALKELAPGGHLHAAINAGNAVLVQKDAGGAVTGITVDLARELGRRLNVPVDLVHLFGEALNSPEHYPTPPAPALISRLFGHPATSRRTA